MENQLCTCTNQNCTESHDLENLDRANYKIWFTGEMANTVTFADTAAEAIAEVKGLTENAPEEFPLWKIRDRAAKRTWSADKFARCA